jgi:hypothetical protein
LVDLIGGDDHGPPETVEGADTVGLLAQGSFGNDKASGGQQLNPFTGRPPGIENGRENSHSKGSSLVSSWDQDLGLDWSG